MNYTPPPEEREARLPQWAQDTLRRLRRRIEDLEAQRSSETPTRLAFIDAGRGSTLYLPEHGTLEFRYGERGLRRCIAVSAAPKDEGWPEGAVHVIGDFGGIALYPCASNTVVITPRGRF